MTQPEPDAIVRATPAYDEIVLAGVPQPPREHHAPPNLFSLLHASFRGRYILLVVCALVALVAGGVAGFAAGDQRYQADTVIRIHPRLNKILFESDQSSITPMFSSFVRTQANLLQNERVVTRAINSDDWRALGRSNGPRDATAFRKSIVATVPRDTPELIGVSFIDPEPRAAKVGLEQTLRAYEALFSGESQREFNQLKQSTLETRRRTLQDDINKRRDDIRKEAAEYGTDDLSQLHAMQMARLLEAERRIGDLHLAIAERETAPKPAEAGDPEPVAKPVATPELIAQVDRTMAALVGKRNEIEGLLASLRSRGFGENHPDIVRVSSELEPVKAQILDYARAWNETHEARSTGNDPGAQPGETLDQMKARLARLKEQADRWRSDAVIVGNKQMAIETRAREIATLQVMLDGTNRALDEMSVESKVEQAIGRIEIIYPEAIPSVPSIDTRKKLAVLGGGGAMGFVIGVFFLIGQLDRRCRYSDEVNTNTDGKLLACLPVMAGSTDQNDAIAAAHSVHRVRLQLQIVCAGHRSIAVTSASPGDGKTSMSLSLGISFAAVGRRTLLIDLDLIGRGLSSRLRMKTGQGVMEALESGTPEGFTRPSHAAGLDILPIGDGLDASAARLKRDAVAALLERAAQLYDSVIIDTGPILGSLEANLACASANGTLLVVGRGQSKSLVKRAVKQLRDINSHLVGVVFNRARDTDFRSSSVSASVRSVRPDPSHSDAPRTPVANPVDPLADVVFVDAYESLDLYPLPG